MEIGCAVSMFCLPDRAGKQECLRDYEGKWVVPHFYPKDNTSGCMREPMDFSEHLAEFEKLNAAVIEISLDSPANHQIFFEKHNLRVLLLSDERHEVADAYGFSKL
jgi:peroxiredoxin Q/BCP